MTVTEAVAHLADTIAGTQAAVGVGFTLGFVLLAVVLSLALRVARRADTHDLALAAHDSHLADIRGDIAAICAHLGIEITEETPVDTDEIPAQERPRPMPGPRTEPTEVAAVVAVTADDWLEAWRRDTDREIAEMKRGWETAA